MHSIAEEANKIHGTAILRRKNVFRRRSTRVLPYSCRQLKEQTMDSKSAIRRHRRARNVGTQRKATHPILFVQVRTMLQQQLKPLVVGLDGILEVAARLVLAVRGVLVHALHAEAQHDGGLVEAVRLHVEVDVWYGEELLDELHRHSPPDRFHQHREPLLHQQINKQSVEFLLVVEFALEMQHEGSGLMEPVGLRVNPKYIPR